MFSEKQNKKNNKKTVIESLKIGAICASVQLLYYQFYEIMLENVL